MDGQDTISRREALALLQWQAEMGVDEVISEAPQDRFAQPHEPPRSEASRAPERTAVPPPSAMAGDAAGAAPSALRSANEVADDARRRARSAATLEELQEILAGFDGCPLKATAKHLCFARGNAAARAMFIGEAPGRDEDLQGKPFVGRAGRLLDKMLAAIGLDEDSAYITNIVYWRPPGNRTPTPQEVQACLPFLKRQIELVDPAVIVLLGGAAAKQLLETTQGIMRLRGRWQRYPPPDGKYRAMATLHPAYLLRQPGHKRLAWRDFLEIRAALAG